jgi:hypothetical protein
VRERIRSDEEAGQPAPRGSSSITLTTSRVDDILAWQNFAELIVGLSLIHPNIVPFYGYMKDWVAWDEPTIIPQSPLVYKLSIVSLYMPKLDVLDYVRSHPLLTALDRLRLVPLRFLGFYSI